MLCKRVGFFEEGYICRGSSSTTKGELGVVGQEGHLALIGGENIFCKQCMYVYASCLYWYLDSI